MIVLALPPLGITAGWWLAGLSDFGTTKQVLFFFLSALQPSPVDLNDQDVLVSYILVAKFR